MKLILISILCVSALFADIKVGETLPTFKLVDQFDEKVEVETKGDTILIFSFQKDVSSEIKKYIDGKEKTFLEDNNIVYISDISSMPSFITSWFALPKMKKFAFKIALIYDEEVGDVVPRKEDKVTVLKLSDNSVTSINFVKAKELDTLLK